MSADPKSSNSSTSLSLPRTVRSNQYNLNSPRVPFRDSTEWASQPPKAGSTPPTTMSSSTSGQARQRDTTSSPESKQRFRVPSSSNAINTIRSTLVALSDATAPAPRSKSKPRSKDPEEEDILSCAYGFVEPPTLLYDTYSSAPPSYDEACFTSNGNGSNHLQRQDISSTADTIRSIARKVRKELVNGGR